MKKLLIIDDLVTSREMLKAILCNEFEILEAQDGIEGIEVLSKHDDVTIIMLDLLMPRMGGLEFLQKVRANEQYKNIAIIVNTAFGEASDEITALSIGADDFIYKPFTPELIKIRIKNVLTNREMLANTESKFGLQRNILDETTTAVYVVDAVNYNLFYTNNAVEKLFKCEQENYSGKKCYEFFGKRNRPCDFCKLAIAHTEDNISEMYLPFLDKTMKIRVRMMEWLGRPAYIIYMDDITEQKIARQLADERYQRELERRSRVNLDFMAYLLINVTKGIVVEHDPHGFPVPTIAPGQPASEFVERVLPTVIDFDKRQEFANMLSLDNLIKSYENGKHMLTIDYRRYARDEKIIMWARSTIQLMKDPQTEEITAFLYTYDINENKMMQEVIRAAVHYDYDMLAHLNLFSETYKCYAQNNPKFDEFIKQEFPYELTIKKYIMKHVALEEQEETFQKMSIETIEKMLQDNDLYEIIINIVGKDGVIRHKKIRYANFDKKYGMVLFTSVDVTVILEEEAKRHKEISKALRLSRQSNTVKTDFLSAISHEMRTPMNTILGMANIAEEDMDNSKLVLKSLQTIKESTGKLMEIVSDILDMSKLESGKMVFARELCDINKEMDLLKNIIKPLFATKNQEFLVEKQIYHTNCFCDIKQIQRVLINLLTNAAKFTPQNGTIDFKVFELPSCKENFTHFRFLVQDNGIGIPANRLERIFEPFYRMEKAAEGKVEDSGLGLAIAKGIVDACGGNIDIKSEINVGTTFIVDFYFEVANAEVTTKIIEQPDPKDIDLRGLKILIAEDKMVSILVARKLLEKKGVVVEYVNNGHEAYHKFVSAAAGSYDLILMDINMPEMGGYTATQLIRGSDHAQAKEIPIIAMTSSIFEDDEKKCLAAGMNDYITKPLKIERLFKMILKHTSKS